MYNFRENKKNINHNFDVIDIMNNLPIEAFESIDYFNNILQSPDEEVKEISIYVKNIKTKFVNIIILFVNIRSLVQF